MTSQQMRFAGKPGQGLTPGWYRVVVGRDRVATVEHRAGDDGQWSSVGRVLVDRGKRTTLIAHPESPELFAPSTLVLLSDGLRRALATPPELR